MWPQGNGGKKGSLPLTADINVTSLVDVAFTLLVIFIITAPIMQGGVEVQLPKGDVPAITQTEGIVVSVTRDGKIYIGDVEAKSVEDFKVMYPQVTKQKGVQTAYLKVDREVPYGTFARVLALMEQLDVPEVGLVYEPEAGS
ncbi:MAG TPA: biopolymer transporter ExbD [Longimicrobiales bacterium]